MDTDIGRSRRRAALGCVLAAALVAGCGGDSAATTAGATTSGAASDAAPAQTLALESQLSAAPRTHPWPGSSMVFSGMLFEPHGSSAIGRSQGSCTRTARGPGPVYQCLLSFVLRDGVVYGQSLSSQGGPATGAITGGTDHYAGARGTFAYKATGSPRVDLTMRLSR